jgi:dihydroceramidase
MFTYISSSVNFCETDYKHSSFIAEYYNTLSSIPMIILGFYGYYYYKKLHNNQINWRFVVLICIGFGSTLFHATMVRFSQLLDEIPMIWLNSFLIYEMVPSYIWFVSAGTITYYYTLYNSYEIFLLYFIASGLFVFFIPIFYLRKNIFAKKLLYLSLGLFIIGFTKWVIDNSLCHHVSDYYLHAWWHIWSGFSVYFYIQFQMAMKPHNVYKYIPLLVIQIITPYP